MGSCSALRAATQHQRGCTLTAGVSHAGAEPVLAHVLVATDAALRGLDASLPASLAMLVSYDCPSRKARPRAGRPSWRRGLAECSSASRALTLHGGGGRCKLWLHWCCGSYHCGNAGDLCVALRLLAAYIRCS